MNVPTPRDARRARRALRWYPKAWRDRYGDEFCALLELEFEERDGSARRALDVAWGGLVARAAHAGIAGLPRADAGQARASLAWVATSVCAFLAFGLAMWSQLVVGWQWTSPRTEATTSATVVMSAAVLGFLVLGALALAPIAATVARQLVTTKGRRLVVPAAMSGVAVAVLVIGARHFENGWPGTGGHHWAHQGLVPGGLAAFVWASTLGVSSYWAHPGALRAFPAAEVWWMAVSPVVIVVLGASSATVLRRVELSARVVRFELRLAQAAAAVMGVFALGACLWVFDRQQRPRSVPANLFHAGAIDAVALCVMAGALWLAYRAVTRGLGAAPAGTPASPRAAQALSS